MFSVFRYLAFTLVALIVLTSLTAIAATNTIPSTRVVDQPISFNLNHLKPSACGGITVTNLVTGSGTLTGTPGNDLILAGSGADMIDGLGGDDCILGGGGDDLIDGGDGSDVCIGGPDSDTLIHCETEG